MARKLGRLICGLLLAVGTPAAAFQIKDSVDRFTGDREIVYNSKTPVKLGVPSVVAAAYVNGAKFEGRVSFVIGSAYDRRAASSWKYLRCHNIDWLVDGQPLKLEATKHIGDAVRGGVTEIVIQPLTADQMRTLGAAEKVEYRICTDEFTLNPLDRVALKEIADRVKPAL